MGHISKSIMAGGLTATGAVTNLIIILEWLMTFLPGWANYPPMVQGAFIYFAGGVAGLLVGWAVWKIPNQTVVTEASAPASELSSVASAR